VLTWSPKRWCSHGHNLATLRHSSLLRCKVPSANLLRRLAFAILDVLQRRIARSLPHLWSLAPLRLNNLERRSLNGLWHCGSLTARPATLRLLLRSFLMEATVQLGPAVLRGLAPHVERSFALRVNEDIMAAIGANVATAVAGVNPEARIKAQLGSKIRK
jgi:hypothetical protein